MTGRSRSKDLVSVEDVIAVIYQDGVFRPREAVDLEDGRRLKIRFEQLTISSYYGTFGKASANEMERQEEELLLYCKEL
ncbi:MAG: antitoxin family protein [Candidatus Methanospirareceae archaeon]